MTVAFDAATDLGTATTGALSGTHTPSGTPRAAVVKIAHGVATTDLITGVTYGGVAMTRVGDAIDDTTEPGKCYLYFLGSSVPTGAQTVTVSHTGTATTKWANVETYTASGDVTIAGMWNVYNNHDDASSIMWTEVSALRTGIIYNGQGATGDLTLLSGMSAVHSVDFGNFVARADRETSATTGATTFGWTTALADDWASVCISMIEESDLATGLAITCVNVIQWGGTLPTVLQTTPAGTQSVVAFSGQAGGGANSFTDWLTSMTFSGDAFPEIDRAEDNTGEDAYVWLHHLSPVVDGDASVALTALNTTTPSRWIIVVGLGCETAISANTKDENNQANPSAALDSGADLAIRFGFIMSGLTPASSLTPSNLTEPVWLETNANNCHRLDAETTAATGSVTVGWTSASDDVAAVYVALESTASPITDEYGFASETDAAMPFSADTQLTEEFGFASETDAAMPFLAASDSTVTFGFASETDEAMPFEATAEDPDVLDEFGFASETDTAMPFLAASDQTDEFAFAEETDEAMPFEAEAVADITDEFGFAEETDTAMPFLAEAEEDDSPDEGSPTSPEDSPIDSPIIDSPDEDSPDDEFSPPVDPDDTFCPPFFMARRGGC